MSDIMTKIEELNTTKSDIKAAIEYKGVVIPDTSKLNTYSTYINSIPTTGGTTPTGDESYVSISRNISAKYEMEVCMPLVSEVGDSYILTTDPNTFTTTNKYKLTSILTDSYVWISKSDDSSYGVQGATISMFVVEDTFYLMVD